MCIVGKKCLITLGRSGSSFNNVSSVFDVGVANDSPYMAREGQFSGIGIIL